MKLSRRIIWPCTLMICLGLLFTFKLPMLAAESEVYDLWELRTPYGQSLVANRAAIKPQLDVVTYNVQKGDTLWQLARVYKVDLNLLMAVNNIKNPETLGIGKELVIPLSPGVKPQQQSVRLASRGNNSLNWPFLGTITSNFGWRKGGFHHGLDIAAKSGTPVKALDAGKVLFAGWKNNIYGNAVLIDHGGGMTALYAHNSKNMVKAGDWVKPGQVVAQVGSTGRTTGPHLHLEIRMDDKIVDPKRYLAKR